MEDSDLFACGLNALCKPKLRMCSTEEGGKSNKTPEFILKVSGLNTGEDIGTSD